MQAIVRKSVPSARPLRIRVRLRVGCDPRDLPLYEEFVDVGRKLRCVPGLADDIAAKGIEESPEERFGCIRVEFRLGGSWMRTGLSLSPSPVISPRNRCKGSGTSPAQRW